MDQFFCMRVFTRVVELGTFARASDQLEIARPTATLAVARLEKRLGVRLLQRTTRRLSLTEEGRSFYESCVRILGDLAETEEALSNARASPRGRLRVGTPHSFVHLAFMPALPRFLARHPQLEVEVFMSDRAVDLIEEGLECAVRAAVAPGDSTLVARTLAKVNWLTCASSAYLETRGTPASIAELERHNCVRFISQSTGRSADWQFRKGEERISFTPRGTFGVSALEGAMAAAVGGIGIAQIPDVLGMPLLRSGALKPLLLDFVAPAPPLQVVYPSNRYLSAKVRALADFAAEIFRREGWWDDILALSPARR
jgi:LysR family transcriptional regulator for bpeEF and oprC